MLCSTDVDANPPNGSDRIDPVEDFLVMGVRGISVPAVVLTLVGVVAGLTPLLRVPLDGGVPGWLRPVRLEVARGGDLDFFRDYDVPVARSTFDAVRLDASDFITASTIMYDSTNSGTTITYLRAMRSSCGPVNKVGAAKDSSPRGDPPPKRAVRPLSEDAMFD